MTGEFERENELPASGLLNQKPVPAMTSKRPPKSPDGNQDHAASPDGSEESVDAGEVEFKRHFQQLEELGSGSFGEVYNGLDLRTHQYVAIKVERTMNKGGSLKKEAERYQLLSSRLTRDARKVLPEHSEYGIPKMMGFFETAKKSRMVMEKLGPSLESLYMMCQRKFSLQTVCQIAIQMLDRIQTVHQVGMLHRDIKPDNFVIGCQYDPVVGKNFIRIIDFGLSRDYVQETPKGLRHIAETTGRDVVGTVRYVSIRVHEGVEQSRRDDIEAIGHVLIYFLKPLPWMGITAPENLPDRQKAKVRYKLVGEKKKEVGIDGLCEGLPPQFRRYMQYARNEIDFSEIPDYNWLRTLFKTVMEENEFTDDALYDWDLLDNEDHDHVRDLSSTNKAVRPQT